MPKANQASTDEMRFPSDAGGRTGLKVAHLSDMHIRRDYAGTMLTDELNQPILPTPYFQMALREVASTRPDVIVLTGDLVHEGDADDYRFLREMVDSAAGDVPVIPVLGNHDMKRAFREGYLGLDAPDLTDGPYRAVREIKGWRFVVLDTATEGCGDGALTADDVAWLEGILSKPSQQGTVLLGHHPLESQQGWFCTSVPEGLIDYLQQTDVVAYLCGHAHFNEARILGASLLQSTTESFDYGVETRGQEVVYTEARGYNTCWLEHDAAGRGRAIVHTHQLFPFNPVLHRMPLR